MKKLSFFLAMAMIATTSIAAKATNEQLAEEHPGGWNFDALFTLNKKPSSWNMRPTPTFSLGFISGVNETEGVHINMGQSIELELNNIITGYTPVGRNGLLGIGLGIGWRNYRMTNRLMFAKHDDGSIAIEPYPEGANPKFSRIHTFGFILPLKYYHKIGRGRHTYLALGPELYYTPHACLKTRFHNEDGKQKLKNNDLHFNKVSIGVGAEIIVQSLGIYYKYNPFDVLDTDYGPKFNSMTFGIKVVL